VKNKILKKSGTPQNTGSNGFGNNITQPFEPGATTLEKEGVGYVVASLGVDSGYMPYTVPLVQPN